MLMGPLGPKETGREQHFLGGDPLDTGATARVPPSHPVSINSLQYIFI